MFKYLLLIRHQNYLCHSHQYSADHHLLGLVYPLIRRLHPIVTFNLSCRVGPTSSQTR
jgi:hypothetical protein